MRNAVPEKVRKPIRANTVKGLPAVLELVLPIDPVPPDERIARSVDERRANRMEARGVNDTVERSILFAADDDSGFGDPFDALELGGVDQVDVGTVKGRKIFIWKRIGVQCVSTKQ